MKRRFRTQVQLIRPAPAFKDWSASNMFVVGRSDVEFDNERKISHTFGDVEKATFFTSRGMCSTKSQSCVAVDITHLYSFSLPVRFAVLNDTEGVNPEVSEREPSRSCNSILKGLRELLE